MKNKLTYALCTFSNGYTFKQISYKNFLNNFIIHINKCDIVSIVIHDKDNLLKELYCYNNQLKELTIISGKNIHRIECEDNKLKELDLSMCSNLKYLHCDFFEDENLKLPNHELKEINMY